MITALNSQWSVVWVMNHNILAAILKLKMAPPGAQNLISFSPLRDASVCEATWLWLKYFLLYHGNKNPDGRMDGRSDRVTDDNYWAVAYFVGKNKTMSTMAWWCACPVITSISVIQCNKEKESICRFESWYLTIRPTLEHLCMWSNSVVDIIPDSAQPLCT